MSSDLYFCPTIGEIESAQGSGFKGGTCCAHPELHTYLGYSTPGIEAISQWLSDKARQEHARDHLTSHRWAETIHTEDDGLLHIPVYAPDGTEAEGLVMDREGAVILHAMIGGYLGDCETECHQEGCLDACHEVHLPSVLRFHGVGMHPSDGTALDYVTTAIARHDMVNLVGLEPHQDLPEPDHDFWELWRATARVAITAYCGYTEQSGHRYLSTGCRHGEHGYCQSNTGSQGDKLPAQCKFCGSKCVCSCHTPGVITVAERTVKPQVLTPEEKTP